MAPSELRILSKRSAPLATPIIVGIVCGAVAFNVILMVAWCVLWRRWRRSHTNKKRVDAIRRMSFESKDTLPAGMTEVIPDPPSQPASGKSGQPTYLRMISSLQAPGDSRYPGRLSYPSSPALLSSDQGSTSSLYSPVPSALKRVPSDAREAGSTSRSYLPKQHAKSPLLRMKSEASALNRMNSVGSTSMYSVASAQDVEHGRLLGLQSPPLEPPGLSTIPYRPIPAIVESMDFEYIPRMPAPVPPSLVSGTRSSPLARASESHPVEQQQQQQTLSVPVTLSRSNTTTTSSFYSQDESRGSSRSSLTDVPRQDQQEDLEITPAFALSSFAAAGRAIMNFHIPTPTSSLPSRSTSDSSQSTIQARRSQGTIRYSSVAPLTIQPRPAALRRDGSQDPPEAPPQVCPALVQTFRDPEVQVPPPQIPARSPLRGAFAV